MSLKVGGFQGKWLFTTKCRASTLHAYNMESNDQVLRKFLGVLLWLQLSHVGGDQPAPVSSMSVELLEAQALHQFVEDACHTN